MLAGKIAVYRAFARQSLALLADTKTLFFFFVTLSVLAALSEGMSITLLVPILEAQGGQRGFANVPILSTVSNLFAPLSPARRIEAVAIAIGVVVVLRNLLQYVVDVLSATIPLQLEQKLNLRSYAALMGVEIAYIHQSQYGSLLNGLGAWSQRVTMVLASIATILSNLMTVAVYGVLMLAMSWQLTAMAVAFLVLMSLMLRWLTSSVLQRTGRRLSEATSRVNQLLMETVTGMKLIRLTAAEPMMSAAYRRAVESAYASQRGASKAQALTAPLLTTCATLFICLLLFVNAAIHDGEPGAWIGSILLFLFLLFRLIGPINSINTARARMLKHMHAFDMLNAFYEQMQARRQPNGSRPAMSPRQLTFDNVTFAYKSGERPAIEGLCTKIEHGVMTAIVGPSGAGKSTLIALLARLYDPQRGRILVDGIDLRELEVRSWRRRLAVVPQDTFIFNDTVARNIGFGHADVPLERIKAAAELAAAAEFIEKLPQGYDTVVGDRGVRLSGGQQQRLAIARAILADPDLVIFDEATSHLDTFTERAIQDAIERMSKQCTVLVIAHRLSTVRRADKVLVLQDGRLVEEGRHQELLARRGFYWEMVEHQRLEFLGDDAGQTAEEAHA